MLLLNVDVGDGALAADLLESVLEVAAALCGIVSKIGRLIEGEERSDVPIWSSSRTVDWASRLLRSDLVAVQ